jgi:hypothetical protein
MNSSLRAILLNVSEADRAYPIAQVATGVTLPRWRAFVSRRAGGDGSSSGIMVAQDTRAYVLGFGSFYVADDLRCGPFMVVDNLFALDLMGGHRVSRFLLHQLTALAKERDCHAIETHLSADPAIVRRDAGDLLPLLDHDGHHLESVCARLDFDPVQDERAVALPRAAPS